MIETILGLNGFVFVGGGLGMLGVGYIIWLWTNRNQF